MLPKTQRDNSSLQIMQIIKCSSERIVNPTWSNVLFDIAKLLKIIFERFCTK